MFSNYCTFYNNTVIRYWCIYLRGDPGTISKTNIILNNSPDTSFGGVVYVHTGNCNLKECIFDQNKNILLYRASGTLQLINCYYLKGSSSRFGSITNSLISTNTKYYIYSTYYCSYSHPKLNSTISISTFPSISFIFFIIFFSK